MAATRSLVDAAAMVLADRLLRDRWDDLGAALVVLLERGCRNLARVELRAPAA